MSFYIILNFLSMNLVELWPIVQFRSKKLVQESNVTANFRFKLMNLAPPLVL